eukprot:746977-Hanusia_phi.AAC.2
MITEVGGVVYKGVGVGVRVMGMRDELAAWSTPQTEVDRSRGRGHQVGVCTLYTLKRKMRGIF